MARMLTSLYNERPTWLALAHDTLDAAVFAAYGWDPATTDEQLQEALLLTSELPVDLGAVPHVEDGDRARLIVDRVHDAIVPDPNPVTCGRTVKLQAPMRSRVAAEGVRLEEHRFANPGIQTVHRTVGTRSDLHQVRVHRGSIPWRRMTSSSGMLSPGSASALSASSLSITSSIASSSASRSAMPCFAASFLSAILRPAW